MSTALFSPSFDPNSTYENVQSTSTNASERNDAYDHQGAAMYIAVILIWYSTGLAMMLFLQVRPRTLEQQFFFDSLTSAKNRQRSSRRTPFTNYRDIQATNNTKQILNELKDPERRQRLWKIYYASTERHDEPYPQYYQTITSDSATIDRIKRKLADIHRLDSTTDENPNASSDVSSTNPNRSTTASAFDSTKFFTKRFPSLRRPIGNTASATNTRPPLIRVQSQPDTTSANVAVEMEPLVSSKQPVVPPTNASKNRTNPFSNRFTIEKVSNDDPPSHKE